MGICDNIQYIGNTLEDNLNYRGVDCTFGIGTGEQNISDMVELITKQNIRGIGDANIQIIPNRPYVTSGETIDVTVRLLNGVGNPLPNQIITITDGTNSYNGTTDNDGIYTLFNQTITTTTTYTVTYGTETKTAKVQLCEVVDYGVTNNNKLSYWYWVTNYGSGSVGDDGTTFTATSTREYITASATLTSPATSSIYIYDFPLTVEFDIVSYEDPSSVTDNSRVRVYNNANNKIAYWSIKDYGVGHYKIVCSNGSQKLYYNGVEQSRSFTFTPTTAWNVAFQTKGHIKYKNFRIY